MSSCFDNLIPPLRVLVLVDARVQVPLRDKIEERESLVLADLGVLDDLVARADVHELLEDGVQVVHLLVRHELGVPPRSGESYDGARLVLLDARLVGTLQVRSSRRGRRRRTRSTI